MASVNAGFSSWDGGSSVYKCLLVSLDSAEWRRLAHWSLQPECKCRSVRPPCRTSGQHTAASVDLWTTWTFTLSLVKLISSRLNSKAWLLSVIRTAEEAKHIFVCGCGRILSQVYLTAGIKLDSTKAKQLENVRKVDHWFENCQAKQRRPLSNNLLEFKCWLIKGAYISRDELFEHIPSQNLISGVSCSNFLHIFTSRL